MLRARVFGLAVVVASTVLRASVAHAGPVEQLSQLVLQPGHPETRILRYENGGDGLFYSHDGGMTFDLLCVSAIDPTMQESGPIAMTGDGATLMGEFKGMWQDDGHGCGWTQVADLDGWWITDFAQHPTDPAITFAITSSAGKANGIFRRNADASWTEVGKREEVLMNTLDVVAVGDKLRFYEGLLRTTDNGPDAGSSSQYVLRYSDDEAKTWTEYPFESDGDGQVRIVAIDPTSPDRVVVTIDRQEADDSVLVSTDKAKTFREYASLSQYGGIAFAPDGRVWIGEGGKISGSNPSNGLWAAASLDEKPTKLADYVVQCVNYDSANGALFACQHWNLGAVDQKTGEFTATFKLVDAKGFLSCEGEDMPAMCKSQLCLAYCGRDHFAQAPLCTAYDEPSCGPAAATPGLGGTGGNTSGSSGTGGSGGGGTGGMLAGGGGGNDDVNAGSGAKGGSSAMTDGGSKKSSDSGGCAVSQHDGAASGFAPTSLASVALALLLAGRRGARRGARRRRHGA